MVSCDGGSRVEEQSTLPGHLHLRTTYMLLLEEKLAVEVAHFNRVQVNLGLVDGALSDYRSTTGRSSRDLLTATMSLNPVNTKFFSSSQPMPPVPTTSTRDPSIASPHRPDMTPTLNNAHYTCASYVMKTNSKWSGKMVIVASLDWWKFLRTGTFRTECLRPLPHASNT